MEERNVIGITMGDPGSIGPEITVKALGNPSVYEKIRPMVIGDAWVMEEALKITRREDLTIHPVDSVGKCRFESGIIDVFDLKIVDKGKLLRASVSKESGEGLWCQVISKSGGFGAETLLTDLAEQILGNHYMAQCCACSR